MVALALCVIKRGGDQPKMTGCMDIIRPYHRTQEMDLEDPRDVLDGQGDKFNELLGLPVSKKGEQ